MAVRVRGVIQTSSPAPVGQLLTRVRRQGWKAAVEAMSPAGAGQDTKLSVTATCSSLELAIS